MFESNDRDFVFYETINEVLLMAQEHLELARNAKNDVMLGAGLRLATKSLTCALEMYGDYRFAKREHEKEMK